MCKCVLYNCVGVCVYCLITCCQYLFKKCVLFGREIHLHARCSHSLLLLVNFQVLKLWLGWHASKVVLVAHLGRIADQLDHCVILNIALLQRLIRIQVQLLSFEVKTLIPNGHRSDPLELIHQIGHSDSLILSLQNELVPIRAVANLNFQHLGWFIIKTP